MDSPSGGVKAGAGSAAAADGEAHAAGPGQLRVEADLRAGEPEGRAAAGRAPRGDGAGKLEAAPGLARIAAGAWVRTASWTLGTTMRAGARVGRAVAGGESPTELLRDVREEAAALARVLLGVDALGRTEPAGPEIERDADPLRSRGAALLEASADLVEHGEGHPAYARILEQISPDEARILRLLATDGPQAAVDVRTWRPLDIGSRVAAPGLTMIGQHAGVMHQARVPAYLSNLFRLGLIWFSRDQLPDPAVYQVLEAQPDVIDAIRATGRARVVRRSIHLTPFGGHFCAYCLPLEPGAVTAEFDAIRPEALERQAAPVDPAAGSPSR